MVESLLANYQAMTDSFQFESGQRYSIKVHPNASSNRMVVDDDGLIRVYVTAVAADNQANQAVIKFFKKTLKLSVDIVKGHQSRMKMIEVMSVMLSVCIGMSFLQQIG